MVVVMVVDMPRFSGLDDRYCPKCSSDKGFRIKHYPRSSYASLSYEEAVALGGAPKHDWLVRSCNMCGYSWFELCADHQESSDG